VKKKLEILAWNLGAAAAAAAAVLHDRRRWLG